MLWPKKPLTEHHQNYLLKPKLWKEIWIFNMKTKELKNLSVSQLEKELANFKKDLQKKIETEKEEEKN